MTEQQSSPQAWWRQSVVYQLYVRSFADLNGDGTGDLGGIAERLDYIAQLGVDAIWLNPCYPSPGHDGGYDIVDYLDIDADYGGLPGFEKLLSAAHERDIKVLMDLVPNHCSSLHPWFQQALGSPPGSPARQRFHFRDGRGADGSEPPNNWRSTFSGPAWTRVTGADGTPEQWYLHGFDSTQPDFNWANPEVADMFDEVLRTWLDRGVDGFRIDVAHAMVKHPDLPDAERPEANPHAWNQPGVHDIFRRWRAVADTYRRDIPLVGEIWLPAAEAAEYIRPGRLHQAFYFDLILQPWDAGAFRTTIDATIANTPADGGVATWVLNNHDVHRSVSRYGLLSADPMQTDDVNARRTRARGTVDPALGLQRARAAAMLLLALPGSVYLYQGEELGLPEVMDLPDDARHDPIWQRSRGREHGRDGSRVPLPWTRDGDSFGFSLPDAQPPWLPQPRWYRDYAVEVQEADPASTLNLYRAAVRTRRELFAGDFGWLDAGRPDVLAFRHGRGVSVTVMGAEPYTVPERWGALTLSSNDVRQRTLPPNSTAWLRSPDGHRADSAGS